MASKGQQTVVQVPEFNLEHPEQVETRGREGQAGGADAPLR